MLFGGRGPTDRTQISPGEHSFSPLRNRVAPARRRGFLLNVIISLMSKLKVGVLRGGPSSEYDVSLKTGESVLKNLPEKYQGIDVLIDKNGLWHIEGIPYQPPQIFNRVNVIFNAMHGEYGEDGKVQQLLDAHGIPYTGSKSLASAMAMHKEKAKNIFKQHGLKTPAHRLLKIEFGSDIQPIALELFRTFPMPLIIKPVGAGSSVGVYLARNFNDVERGLREATQRFSDILVEEYINGRETTVGVIDQFRNQSLYVLPAIEIRPPIESPFFDLDAKYSGKSEEICPGNFSSTEKEELAELAKKAHQILGLRHYSRSDFIIHPRRGIYILETNTLPGLTSESLFPKALKSVGSSLPDFLDHLLTLASHS
jgi:D-alanine-D-alanine ligase